MFCRDGLTLAPELPVSRLSTELRRSRVDGDPGSIVEEVARETLRPNDLNREAIGLPELVEVDDGDSGGLH